MEKKKGRGFYLAVALVIAGAAASGVLAVSQMMHTLEAKPEPQIEGQEDIPWKPYTPAEEKQNDVPVKPQPSVSEPLNPPCSSSVQPESASSASAPPAASSAPSGSAASSVQPVREPPSFTQPIAGEPQRGFTGDELVYDETMADWRTHNGVDYAGREGEPVASPACAAVKNVLSDLQWGNVVELEQNGLTVRVCGLDEVSVKAGDTLQAGEPIGTVGVLPAESGQKPHVHLEFIRNGSYEDPSLYIKGKES